MPTRSEWVEMFRERGRPVHKHMSARTAPKIVAMIDRAVANIRARSRALSVEADFTRDELRSLVYRAYAAPCRYCETVISRNTLVIDHILPISKGGTSNILNLQVICKTCNGVKGSLEEVHFIQLLDWLSTIPTALADNIRKRLCGLRL